MKRLCYINGDIMPASDGSIGIADLALQRGYGVFDYGRTYNGKLFHFEDNIERFRRSASALHLTPPISDEEILEIARKLIEESELKTPAVRLLLTGGYSAALEDPNFVMVAEELPTYPHDVYRDGARIITFEYQRELPHVKSTNYLNYLRLEPHRREKNAFDILYHSRRGITECPRSNFFAFVGDTLTTPSEDVLHGITRKLVLQLAASHFDVEERKMSFEELENIDEAFVTSTSKRIIPVSEIDDKKIGNHAVGDRTKKIMRLFDEYTEAYMPGHDQADGPASKV